MVEKAKSFSEFEIDGEELKVFQHGRGLNPC
jgi:hypothetical protein